MTNFKSPEVEVNVSAEVLYNKLSNVNNLRNILPPQVSEFQSTEDSCCFKIGGMPTIHLEIAEKIPNSKISLIGNYYFSFAELYEDIDMKNRSIQFYLSYEL